jgi:hypothetical protein
MSRYGTITDPATATVQFVESAQADDLESRVNAKLAELFAADPARAVSGITLAGGGDGHTFVVEIESALASAVDGGITASGARVRCYLASENEALAVVRSVIPITDVIVDEQVAGAAKGTRFMGIILLGGGVVPPLGPTGPTGAFGPTGTTGATGAAGPSGTFGSFFALMPGDNASTVAVGAAVEFPQDGAAGSGVTRSTASQFVLADVGVYEISWQVSVSEAGQLALDVDSGGGPLIVANSVAGRATGTSQISNHMLLTTSVPNSVLRVINPAGNAAALTITPIAGGTHSVSAWLLIKRIA